LAKHAESSAAGGAAVDAAADECSIKGHKAVNMIRDALKDQFVDFFELYEAAGVDAFDAALRQFIESEGVHAHAA
jgi:hypothetical protein